MRNLCLTLLALLAPSLFTAAPEDDVRALQAKYRAERDRVTRDGTAQRFPAVLLERAEEMAKKGDDALAGGRLAQAREAFRQARWQLPYQTKAVPPHVARILGSLRLRHSNGLQAVAFSPDGRRLATGGGDGNVTLWDLDNGHETVTFAGHGNKNAVTQVAFAPDGKSVVSAAGKEVKSWDAASAKELINIPFPGPVTALAVAPDGKYLAAAFTLEPKAEKGEVKAAVPAANHALQVFEAKSGKVARTVEDFRGKVTGLAFHPAGTLLAAGDEQGVVRLWEFPQMAENANAPAYWSQQDAGGAAFALAFSPDGQTLARTGPVDVKLYPVPAPGNVPAVVTPRRAIPNPNSAPQHSAVYSKDGKTLFTGGTDGLIRAWDPDAGQPTATFRGHTGKVWALALHPAGAQLVSASDNDTAARLWDLDLDQAPRDLAGHAGPVWMASFSPDGRYAVSAGADRSVKVWDLATDKVRLELTGHTAPATTALYSPDGKVIASAGGDKTVRLWDAATGKPLHVCTGHQATVTTLDFSPDGKRLASGGADRQVHVWDVATGKAVLALTAPSVVTAVAFRPDGQQLAVATVDHSIALYDPAGKSLQRWTAHGDAVTCLAFSPDGQYLASGGADGALQVWPTATPGEGVIHLGGHQGPVSMVAFRKDSQHLVSAGSDQLVRLWKIEGNTGKEVQTFKGHRDWVTAAAFSRDGYHIVSASVDKLVKVWEITSRDLPLAPEHTGGVESLAVSPDGKVVASGARDSTIRLWDRATGAEVGTLSGHPSWVMALAFTPDSKVLVSSGIEGALRFWETSPPRELARTAGQLQAFNQMVRYSPYLFIEPAGKLLYAWLPMADVRVTTTVECFDLKEGTKRFTITEESPRKVNSLAFCANGKLAATGAADGSVKVYDLEQKGATLPGGDRFLFDKIGVADLALTPDGKTLVVTSDEGEVKVADVVSRKERRTFKAHPGRIMACITSPDGKRCVTLGLDNVLKVWELDSGRELRRWELARPVEGADDLFVHTLAFTPDGKQLVTANANSTLYLLDLP